MDLTWSHWSHLHQCPSGCFLNEDGPLEVLLVPAHCQDIYQGWISFYCWAPFHATLIAIPKGSRCRWDQISSELSSGIQLLASCSPTMACGHP
ncbi:hypothetical protein DV515_00016857 [Chloebia gouldiae]|uniref:Uncharacterized protein n=1 Tax=Chloebia gouldiae TaxID=44316 RepID=A0A3L8RAG2_CHLGU|nr:hypothetical protein DV515_00016857 [Chloebia gouldiae]